VQRRRNLEWHQPPLSTGDRRQRSTNGEEGLRYVGQYAIDGSSFTVLPCTEWKRMIGLSREEVPSTLFSDGGIGIDRESPPRETVLARNIPRSSAVGFFTPGRLASLLQV
jgi:hypothetical protein